MTHLRVAAPRLAAASAAPSVLAGLPHPVALVLGGGGCLGAAQAGVVAALEEHGFIPDLIVGTSVGALNGVIAAAHPASAAAWLAAEWARTRRHEVLPLRLPWRQGTAGGVCTNDGLRRLIARAGLPNRLEDLPVPFHAVAMDVDTGAPAVLTTGGLESALLASTAIPGVLPPVERDGALLVDGGVVAYVPVVAALEAGAASLVVVRAGREDCQSRSELPHRARSIATRSGRMLLRHQIERDLHDVSRQVPTVMMPTGIGDWPRPWDFSQSRRLMTTARVTSRHFLGEPHESGGLRQSGPDLVS